MAKKLSEEAGTTKRLLGLSTREWQIFEIVQKSSNSLNVSEIARQAKVNRTTAGYILHSLNHRCLIGRLGTKTRPLYSPVARADIEVMMHDTLQNWPLTDKQLIHHSKASDLSFHSGGPALFRLWQEIASLPKYTRVRGIQPDVSFALALSHIHGQIPHEDIVNINRNIGRRKIIVEAIVHEKSVDTIASTLTAQGESPVQFLDSFSKRAADTAKLPEDFLNIPAEMYLFQDTAIIMYWPEEYAIRIQNKDIVAFLTGLFNATKYLSERYNQNERVAKKLLEGTVAK